MSVQALELCQRALRMHLQRIVELYGVKGGVGADITEMQVPVC